VIRTDGWRADSCERLACRAVATPAPTTGRSRQLIAAAFAIAGNFAEMPRFVHRAKNSEDYRQPAGSARAFCRFPVGTGRSVLIGKTMSPAR
jgi:hypothetical protein